jgi:iron complex transport system ATP-binding protein
MGELRLDGITAGYGPRAVVEGVSLQVEPGEVVGLVGPNGSGKTTLVRVASRALRPRAGRVMIGRRDLHEVGSREAARLVAVVPQEITAVFPFTVLEMVLMGRAPHRRAWGGSDGNDWARVREAMEAANVQHLADRPFQDLSGGERQRVILAQALAQGAPILLLDEPTTHLDVRHVLDVIAVVRGLVAGGDVGALAIFHDLTLAAATSDRMYAVAGGRIVAEGSPGAVVTPSLLREVYGVEADVHVDAATGRPVVSLGRLPSSRTPSEGMPRVHVVGGAGRGASLMRALAERGLDVSAGVLHGSDTDADTAERLNLVRVSVPPFSRIDAASAAECLGLMERAGLVVVADAPYGPGNVENLRLALAAAERGVRVVVLEEVPIGERDFTGGEATALWEALRGAGSVAGSAGEVLRAVAGAASPSERG